MTNFKAMKLLLRRHPLSTYKKVEFQTLPPPKYALVRSHKNFNKYILSDSTPSKIKQTNEINLNKFHN
jgi:hypothetical protein